MTPDRASSALRTTTLVNSHRTQRDLAQLTVVVQPSHVDHELRVFCDLQGTFGPVGPDYGKGGVLGRRLGDEDYLDSPSTCQVCF